MHIDLEKEQELRELLKRRAEGVIAFLDSIDSVEEFDSFVPILFATEYEELVPWYRENLRKWDDPRLPEQFQETCPLLTARLDAPWKIRVYLRGVDFMKIDPISAGRIFEEIIKSHEVQGRQKVSFEGWEKMKRDAVLHFLTHTQIQIRTLHRLIFPGYKMMRNGTGPAEVIWEQ